MTEQEVARFYLFTGALVVERVAARGFSFIKKDKMAEQKREVRVEECLRIKIGK